MLAFFIATFVSLCCVVYSLRAMRDTIQATATNPARIAHSLRIGDAIHKIEKAKRLFAWSKNEPRADLENDLLDAMLNHDGEGRIALVNTVLGEIDHRAQRLLRVPRVCARVSSTVGLLSGSMALRQGLIEGSLDVSPLELLTRGPVADMLGCVLMGIAGAIWCSVAANALKKSAKQTLTGEDDLVTRLQAAVEGEADLVAIENA